MVTLEAILDWRNILEACRQVVANGGSAGVDGMQTTELRAYLKEHYAELMEPLRAGKYKPLPVRRVYIPKEERGKTRPLGIPTVRDRLVQQATAQILVREYEPVFHPSSNGFRPNRGCHTALEQVLAYANSGYRWVVDLDLAKFFDTVNHSKLLQVMSERIKDGRVISLVHKMMRAPISEKGKLTVPEVGTPQGGPVSPVLANILLNELDWELERRGHKFVRYADDMMIFCGSKKAARRTLAHLKPFIEQKLFLKLNEQKSKICYITKSELKFLGFGFYNNRGKIAARPHQKSREKCLNRLRDLTRRSRGQSLDVFKVKLSQFIRGWVAYFKPTSMKTFVKDTDEWLRRRIRQLYWKQWKRISKRFKELQNLGVPKDKAWQWANTRKSYWRTAGSHILSMTLTNKVLRKAGWPCLADAYR